MQKIESIKFYHFPICPYCRVIRFLLNENKVIFEQKIEDIFIEREKFQMINPSCQVPFLVVKKYDTLEDEMNKSAKYITIFGFEPILTYIFDKLAKTATLPFDADEKVKVTKMMWWFNHKFYNEVTEMILQEKVYVWIKLKRNPNQELLRAPRKNLAIHLRFISSLIEKSDGLISEEKSFADTVAACHLSSLDYLGEIDWNKYPSLKEWYSAIKSKPSFRDILYDIVPSIKPSAWYRELDF